MQKYVGMGLYVSEWQAHDGPEGNLSRETENLMYGPSKQYATSDDPQKHVGTFATYPELGQMPASAQRRVLAQE